MARTKAYWGHRMPAPTGDFPSWRQMGVRDIEKLADQLITAIDHEGWSWDRNPNITGENFVKAFVLPVLLRNQQYIDGDFGYRGCHPFNQALSFGGLESWLAQLPGWQSQDETEINKYATRVSKLASGQLEQILNICDCREDP